MITSNGTGYVGTWPCEPTAWQIWSWFGFTDSVPQTLIGRGQGACLDTNATAVYTHWCNDGDNQAWYIYIPASGGLPMIQSLKYRGWCLTESASTEAIITSCSTKNPKQRWRFVGNYNM